MRKFYLYFFVRGRSLLAAALAVWTGVSVGRNNLAELYDSHVGANRIFSISQPEISSAAIVGEWLVAVPDSPGANAVPAYVLRNLKTG